MRIASLAFLVALLPGIAVAQTWSGLGADNNWSTGANWVGGFAPASSSTTVVTFQLAPTPRNTPIVDVPWTINSMSISGSVNLGGQALTFAGTAPQLSGSVSPRVSAPIVLTGPTTFFSTGSLLLTGGISGTGPLSVGGFTMTITGVSTFTGGLTVNGQLAITGSMPGPVAVNALALLAGAATVAGPVTVNAGGTFNVGPASGVFSAGGVALAGTTNFTIRGPAQGTQYSFLDVTGTVTLAGGPLTLTGPYVPVAGDVFTLIVNDGADAITGSFAGFAEGATINFNGVPLRISYVGGTGNDVTLTSLAALAGPAAAVPTLSEWALLLLTALIAAMGIRSVAMRRSSP